MPNSHTTASWSCCTGLTSDDYEAFEYSFHVQENTWRRFELHDIVYCPAVNCGHKGKVGWYCWAQSVTRKHPPHHQHTELLIQGWMDPYFVVYSNFWPCHPNVTEEIKDSSDQQYFPVFYCSSYWACANCRLSFLPGVILCCCNLLLQGYICWVFRECITQLHSQP